MNVGSDVCSERATLGRRRFSHSAATAARESVLEGRRDRAVKTMRRTMGVPSRAEGPEAEASDQWRQVQEARWADRGEGEGWRQQLLLQHPSACPNSAANPIAVDSRSVAPGKQWLRVDPGGTGTARVSPHGPRNARHRDDPVAARRISADRDRNRAGADRGHTQHPPLRPSALEPGAHVVAGDAMYASVMARLSAKSAEPTRSVQSTAASTRATSAAEGTREGDREAKCCSSRSAA